MFRKFFLFFSIFSLSLFSQEPFGVNLAGAEFGSTMPGTFNIDYTYPTNSELDYFNSKNLKLVRLPFRWERVQNTLGGALNTTEINRIKSFLNAANSRNMKVVLDMHNYGRYKISGTEYIIGSQQVTIEHVKDVWTKLASELKSFTNIWGYGIMNEPHDMLVSTPWFSIAQEIINGIRTQDTSTAIIVGGDFWSSAFLWNTYSDNLKNLIDPSNKIIYEAHCYFDNDGSGTYDQNYTNEGAYPNIGIDRVSPFVNWLITNHKKGYIGEYGIPNNDLQWNTVLDNFQNYLKQNCVNGTYWAAGPWWGNYLLSVEPSAGVDKPQMSVLEKYITTNNNCTYLLDISENNTINKVKIFPNPTQKFIYFENLTSQKTTVQIFSPDGRLVSKSIIVNQSVDISNLKNGLYIIEIQGNTYKIIKN